MEELIEFDVISQEAEDKLEAITPEAVDELIVESKDDMSEMTESKRERKKWSKSEKPLTLKSLAYFCFLVLILYSYYFLSFSGKRTRYACPCLVAHKSQV